MHWQILGQVQAKSRQQREAAIIRVLLKNRGLITQKGQAAFFKSQDPFKIPLKAVGLSSVEIKKAMARIKRAIKDGEKIIVYGDYDADGICATAVAWETLNYLGAKAMPFVPSREEGYGLKVDRIDQFKKDGVGLIITVDQGIVHSRQVKHARKAGVGVIITDHHVVGKTKPAAEAVVHTVQLAGVGVAWFLARELLVACLNKKKALIEVGKLLDLVAIGTVTDMVPLLKANRALVKFGLEELRKTRRPGLLSLYDFAGLDKKEINARKVGFIIGPRLNAAGRMGDPLESLRLVCTPKESRAIGLAQKINQNNQDRQSLTRQTAKRARELWLKEDQTRALIFVYHQSFEHGVIGLVASQLKEEFSRPVIVLGPRDDHWVASARSIEEFNIIKAIRELKDIIGDHGGHRLAAGFSVLPDKLEEAKERLLAQAESKLDQSKLTGRIKIDVEVGIEDLTRSLYQELEAFAPFGQANPQPVFATRGVRVVNSRAVGRDHQHLKLQVADENQQVIDAIGFGFGHLQNQLFSNKPIDLAYNLTLNEWNGTKKLQLKLKDVRLTS